MTRKLSKEELKDKLDGNELDLSLCNLTKVPVRELAFMQQATILDLSCNNLTCLPDSFGSLQHLVRLDLSKNSLTDLPECFGLLTNLQRLDLYSNRLTELPISFVQLSELRWLDLKNNPIQALLPDVVGNCLIPQECKACAQNVISYLRLKRANKERETQWRLRRRKEVDQEEEKQKELRKRLKLVEKQQRREAYETLNRQKRMMQEEMDRDLQAQKEFMETVPKVEKPAETDDLSSILGLVIIMTLITIAVTIGIVVFCYNDAACRELWAAMTQS